VVPDEYRGFTAARSIESGRYAVGVDRRRVVEGDVEMTA